MRTRPNRAWLGPLRWFLAGAAGVALLWLAVAAGNTYLRYAGWTVLAQNPAALEAKLSPFFRITHPEGAGPFPTALLFSGCDGPQDNLDRWAEMLKEAGWAAIIVDSHGPRGLVDHERWRLVCAGQLMLGSERAGDVLVSLAAARRMEFVDPERIVLIGASHGGWAITELLVFEAARELPFGLTAPPEGSVEHPLEGVRGIILLYPYCGPANRARKVGWRFQAPVLMLLAGNDVVAPADDCLALAEAVRAQGVVVDATVFPEVTHGFDQEKRARFSTLAFDAATTAAALDRGHAFLTERALR
jgi:dienelactone hydrolase